MKINCSYIPPEIITAQGYTVSRVWPTKVGSKGRNLLPANCCPYSRAFLSEVIGESEKVIMANSCDTMRRVYDAQINKSYFLQVPRLTNKININFYKEKLKEIKNILAQNNKSQEKNLKKEIEEFNELRKLLKKLRDKIIENYRISFLTLIDVLKNDYYKKDKKKIKEVINSIEKDSLAINKNSLKENNAPRPRVIISGSCLLDKTLVKKVENIGMKVIALDSCLGERSFDFTVKTNGPNLIENLAYSYLNKKQCPRMMNIDKRLNEIKEIISERNADGLIYFIPKFCDQSSYDFKYLKKWFKENNFPILKLEGEYQSANRGQITTRIEAFKESINLK